MDTQQGSSERSPNTFGKVMVASKGTARSTPLDSFDDGDPVAGEDKAFLAQADVEDAVVDVEGPTAAAAGISQDLPNGSKHPPWPSSPPGPRFSGGDEAEKHPDGSRNNLKAAPVDNKASDVLNLWNSSKLARKRRRSASSGRTCCNKRCCLISLGATVLVVGLACLVGYLWIKNKMDQAKEGGASTKDNDLWAQLLGNSSSSSSSGGNVAGNLSFVSGKFVLVSYDNNYETYLTAFGMPSFIVSFVLEAKETMTVEQLSPDRFKVVTETGFTNDEVTFTLGEVFEKSWGRGRGVMVHNATRLDRNSLFFESEEKSKGWKLTSLMEFSKLGVVNTRHFLNQDLVTKKFFQRTGVDFSAEDQDAIQREQKDMIEVEAGKVETADKDTSSTASADDAWLEADQEFLADWD